VSNPLASPRFRRRLVWISTMLGVAGLVAGVMIAFPNSAKRREVFSNEPPQIVSSAKPVRADHARRVQVLDATLRFVSTAVRRDHVDASWTLVDPSLKDGFTRTTWAKGNIPVVPFPAAGLAGWKIDWSYADDVGLDVALLPQKGSKLHAKTFLVELKRHGPGGHWLVASWVPKGVSVESDLVTAGAGQKPVPPPRTLAGKWLLLPLLGVAAVFLVPLSVMAGRGWLRGARAQRAYRRSLKPGSN
jgi:hypothetical protein